MRMRQYVALNGRELPVPLYSAGDLVSFQFPYSARRTGKILRRWWAGSWCYAVSDPVAGHGEWLLSESILEPAREGGAR